MIDEIRNRVRNYMDINKYEKALESAEEGLAIKPRDGYLLFMRGVCLWHLERNEECIKSCEEALESGYSSKACYYQMGITYHDMVCYLKAEECFLNALKINPDDASTLAAYSSLMRSKLKYDKSIELINRALSLDPNNRVVLHYAFYHYLDMGKKKTEQEKILERYIENSSDELGKLVFIGKYQMSRKKYKAAKESFKDAFLLDPTNKYILSTLIELDYMTRKFYGPNRLIQRLGGFKSWVITSVIMSFTIRLIKEYLESNVIIVLGLMLAIGVWLLWFVLFHYTVFSDLICKFLIRRQKKRSGVI